MKYKSTLPVCVPPDNNNKPRAHSEISALRQLHHCVNISFHFLMRWKLLFFIWAAPFYKRLIKKGFCFVFLKYRPGDPFPSPISVPFLRFPLTGIVFHCFLFFVSYMFFRSRLVVVVIIK